MKVYRLLHKEYDGEVVFGLPEPYNKTEGEQLINKYFNKMRPYRHLIPYYKNSKFAFISLNALCTFLLAGDIKKMTEQEWNDINEKFIIQSYEINTWSKGLSKFLCTYFDDEVDEGPIDTLTLADIEPSKFKYVEQPSVPKEDIQMVRENYYSRVKFNF